MEQQQNKPQGFTCTGDCLRCNIAQRQYCAAQFTYNSMRMLEQMQQSLSALQGTVGELTAKMEAIQGNEASIFDPTIAAPADQKENPLLTSNLSVAHEQH